MQWEFFPAFFQITLHMGLWERVDNMNTEVGGRYRGPQNPQFSEIRSRFSTESTSSYSQVRERLQNSQTNSNTKLVTVVLYNTEVENMHFKKYLSNY